MTTYWSAQAPGFYDDQWYPVESMPADRVEVTPEEHQAMMDAQAAGQIIVTNPDTGGPMAVDRPPPPDPTPAEQAAALLNQPVTVQSATNPELEASYRNDAQVRQAMTGIVAQLNAGMGLPGGGATFNWPDVEGNAVQWPDVPFKAFVNAVTNFAYACQQTAGGFDTTVPSNVLDIDVIVSRMP